MHFNTPCYTCEHYLPTVNSKVGLCTILDNCAGPTYYIESSRQQCLFNLTKPPRQLTAEEAQTRDKIADTERQRLWEHCEKVKIEVDSWPDWKKRILTQISKN